MESFIEYCEINKYCPAIFMYKGFDSEELYRNVNHIGGLNDSYQACIKEWDAILWKDTRYRKAKKKQRNSSNKESWDKASEEITYAIRRMNSTSDEYKETRKRMDELVVNRNIAITRYLLEDCQRKGKVLPVTGVITDVIQADILRNSFEIPAMQEDRRLMQNQLQQLKLRLVRGTYDVNQKVTNRIL